MDGSSVIIDLGVSECVACSTCTQGRHADASVVCSEHVDTACTDCPAGRYQSNPTFLGTTCEACSTCGQEYTETKACSPQQNTECQLTWTTTAPSLLDKLQLTATRASPWNGQPVTASPLGGNVMVAGSGTSIMLKFSSTAQLGPAYNSTHPGFVFAGERVTLIGKSTAASCHSTFGSGATTTACLSAHVFSPPPHKASARLRDDVCRKIWGCFSWAEKSLGTFE